MTDLVFGDPPLGSSPDLVFGESTVADGTLVQVSVAGAFAALSFAAAMAMAVDVSATGTFAPVTFDATVSYTSNTQRPTVRQVVTSFQQGTPAPTGLVTSMQQSVSLPTTVLTRWQDATDLSAAKTVVIQDSTRTARYAPIVFQDGTEVSVQRTLVLEETTRIRSGRTVVLQDATPVSSATRMVWQDARRLRNQVGVVFQDGTGLQQGFVGAGGDATSMQAFLSVRFQDARKPPAGTRDGSVVPPDLNACYIPSPHLLFADEWSVDDKKFVFFCENHGGGGGDVDGPPSLVVVPVRRVYLVINDVLLRRTEGSLNLPCSTLSMQLDVDSWTWGFSATLPANQLSNLEPAAFGQPVEVEAFVNGQVYKLLVERRVRSREFGKDSLVISGRGIAAILDVPYSPILNFTNTNTRTAQQLMGDALLNNGVPIGWTVDFGLTDWSVPAGAWAHQGSRLSALQKIAAAAGGYLQPHPTDPEMQVLARYPTAPWAWATVTPDFELPSAVVSVEGIEWVEKTLYDRVFVSGESVGVLGQITRTGRAGTLVAPMVTDPLITTIDAARQRGLSILADTGAQAAVSLKLPVLTETGIIQPGKFVRYVDGVTPRVGLVRSVNVDFGYPEVWQTIEVETHA